MLKKSASFVVLFVLLAFGAVATRAQSDDKKFEVGGQFSVLRVPTHHSVRRWRYHRSLAGP